MARKRSRARYTPFQRAKRKFFRSAVAKLKAKGILPRTVDARKVVPSPKLRKTIRKNRGILEGKERSYKLPDDFPKAALRDLKRQGYSVRNGRLVLPASQHYRKGKVYSRPQGARHGAEITSIRLRARDWEQQIINAFFERKPGEEIGFQIEGANSHNIYNNAESMIRDLVRYPTWETIAKQIGHITLFRTTDPQGYLRARTAERLDMEDAASRRRRQRKNLKRREKRRFQRGMRVVNRGG